MKVMAYMPTWRGLLSKKENKKQIEQIGNYLYDIDGALEENQVLFVKLHPYVKEGLNYDDFEHIRPLLLKGFSTKKRGSFPKKRNSQTAAAVSSLS